MTDRSLPSRSRTPVPYYSDGQTTIYHGDALDLLPLMERHDLVLADPPYNVGKDYGDGHNDVLSVDQYQAWCTDWWTLCRERCARTIVFPGHGNIAMWDRIAKPAGIGCWYKPGSPTGGGVFNFCEWEPWLVWSPRRIGGSDVIRATINQQEGVGDHPCPKPLKLIRELLVKTKATSVLDPFVGSGTTLRAAMDLGIPAVGIDQNERYCENAARRLSQGVLNVAA